mmetsp:Transcript_38113/g.49175  ORF Transcript_38113/g.49175 Transcript_38113/m.49175 type:complete len:640 (+) Transcript_38113:38-1957(+)
MMPSFQLGDNPHISSSVFDKPVDNALDSNASRKKTILGIAVLVVVGLCAVLTPRFTHSANQLRVSSFNTKPSVRNEIVEQDAQNIELKMTAYNRYNLRDGPAGTEYDWLSGNLLAEPYQQTNLKVVSANSDYEYEWTITNTVSEEIEAIEQGTNFVHVFKNLDTRTIALSAYNSDKELVASSESTLYVRYVRREIRNLFDDDLDELLDSMHILWEVEQDEGVEKFGDQYKSIVEMHKFHLKFAGDNICDHLHDGYGFVSQHSAMTMVFEQSLQAVNPKLTVPYWDYTLDVEQHYAEKGSQDFTDFTNSELFTEKYFGNTDESTFRIKNGRWADLEVPYLWDAIPEEEWGDMATNVYGQLRAPWSNNEDPHVIRSTTQCGADSSLYFGMPDCQVLSTLLNERTLAAYMQDISYDPHGPIHIQLGGAVGCEEAYDAMRDYFDNERELKYLKAQAFIFHKSAYRGGIMVCNEAKGDKTCFCPDEEHYKSQTHTIAEFMNIVGYPDYTHHTDDFNKALITTICNSNLVEGDNLQASSSYTPEFWPIHPTVERMIQWKRIHSDFKDLTFPSGGSWIPGAACEGHMSDDVVLMGTATIRTAQGEDIMPTNEELLAMLSPYENTLTFIYDNLRWDYCAAVGYDMSA